MGRERDAALRNGALFALASIGAGVVILFGFLCWLATGGGHSFFGWLKKPLGS